MSDHRKQEKARKRLPEAPAIEWKEYPRIPAGEYRAFCKWGKQYRDPGFKKWLVLLRWDVFSDGFAPLGCVPMFYSLGDSDRPRATRRGKYLPDWVKANGAPPKRGDRLSPRVFVARFARIEVHDANSPIPYSVVCRIVEWETGFPRPSVNKSHSQDRQAQEHEKSEASQE